MIGVSAHDVIRKLHLMRKRSGSSDDGCVYGRADRRRNFAADSAFVRKVAWTASDGPADGLVRMAHALVVEVEAKGRACGSVCARNRGELASCLAGSTA